MDTEETKEKTENLKTRKTKKLMKKRKKMMEEKYPLGEPFFCSNLVCTRICTITERSGRGRRLSGLEREASVISREIETVGGERTDTELIISYNSPKHSEQTILSLLLSKQLF